MARTPKKPAASEDAPKTKNGGARPGSGRPRKGEIRIPKKLIRSPGAAAQVEKAQAILDKLTAQAREQARKQMQAEVEESRKKASAYAKLGELPSDPLAGVDYALRVLELQLVEVIGDASLTDEKRRAETRAITRSMVPLLPIARLSEAVSILDEAQGTIARDTKDPPLTPVGSGGGSLKM